MNKIIIEEFEKLVKLIEMENNIITDKEIYNKNIYRISSFKKNIKKIKMFKKDITDINILKNIKGFGKGTLNRIQEILENGFLKENIEMEKKYNNNEILNNLINELKQVINIGNKTALYLIKKYKINSVSELIDKVQNNQIIVNDKIKLGLQYYGKYNTSIQHSIISDIDNNLFNLFRNNNLHIFICGSYRRGLSFSSDIDILLSHSNIIKLKHLPNNIILFDFITNLKNKNFIIDDITSDNVISKYMGFCKWNNIIYRIDIRLVPQISLYSALVFFTGSKNFNTFIRKKAKLLGYKLNEYGLYNNNNKLIKIKSESDLFKKLNIDYLEPNERI
jgi:DNA polymerase/3'-5' exonuclease PolX